MIKKGVLFLILFLILISFISSSELRVTEEHPFLVDNEWISAKNLQVGDELRTVDGRIARITSIEDIVSDDNVSVYNLEAGSYHNFVVSDEQLVVHNSNTPDSPIPVMLGKELGTRKGDLLGSSAAVFEVEGTGGEIVAKVLRIPPESRRFILSDLRKREIEALKLAEELGLAKYYGTGKVVNTKKLSSSRWFSKVGELTIELNPDDVLLMSRANGVSPAIARKLGYVSDKTIEDALTKYRKLWDAGYVQGDTNFFIKSDGTIDIYDWNLMEIDRSSYSNFDEFASWVKYRITGIK